MKNSIEGVKYRGLTKKKYKRRHGSSTPGSSKGENCQATGLKKAIIKYPRWYKTDPELYLRINKQTDIKANRKTLSGGTLLNNSQ